MRQCLKARSLNKTTKDEKLEVLSTLVGSNGTLGTTIHRYYPSCGLHDCKQPRGRSHEIGCIIHREKMALQAVLRPMVHTFLEGHVMKPLVIAVLGVGTRLFRTLAASMGSGPEAAQLLSKLRTGAEWYDDELPLRTWFNSEVCLLA
jgi:hypothetical protein